MSSSKEGSVYRDEVHSNTIDRSMPVVTPAGGTEAAYKNPNSPESILRRTKQVEVQAATDKVYDIPVSPYADGFCVRSTLRSLLNTPFAPIFVACVGIVANAFYHSSAPFSRTRRI
jgi:hypothetical protein